MHGELLDLNLAIEAYLVSRRVQVPALAEWYMAQERKSVSDRFYMGRRCGNRSATGSIWGGESETGRRPVLHAERVAAEKWHGQLAQWGCGFLV